MDKTRSSANIASRLLSRLCEACMALAIALLAMVAILVVAQVVARNGFDLGLPWADELARFGGLALVFLSIPLLALRGQHVAVDLVPQLIGGRSPDPATGPKGRHGQDPLICEHRLASSVEAL